MAHNQDNVSEWSDMYTHKDYKEQTKRLCVLIKQTSSSSYPV